MGKYKYAFHRSDNGYTGILHGTGSMAIYDEKGHMVFHTRNTEINSQKELEEFVEGYPEFIRMLTERGE